MIIATIKTGRIERFGKDMMKFICPYKSGRVVCIGKMLAADKIKILTVEWG